MVRRLLALAILMATPVAITAATTWAAEVSGAKPASVTRPAESASAGPALKPTLGRKPPDGAIVFIPFQEGKAPSMEAWTNASWTAGPDGTVTVGKGDNLTKKLLADMELHLEFMIPPGEGGGKPPSGGNSGVYIMDRYEIQILDTAGQMPNASSCGAVYRKIAPKVNAALPAGQWQSYDITFHAPKFDDAGKKVKSARVTVVLNGVTVQDDVEIDGPTGSASKKPEVASAPLRLQDHGCPVKFRNVWVRELKE